jgi:transketolase
MDTMRDRFNSVVVSLLEDDPLTVVVFAVIGRGALEMAGALGRFESRVIDVGIREQAMIGVAGGLALEGFKPIVMSYAPFLVERPFEQVKLSLTHQGVNAVMVSVGGSWDASSSGRTHQAPEDVALMSTLPGWTVHVPGHPDEVETAIRSAHASGESHYVRLTVDSNASALESRIGSVTSLRSGSEGAETFLAVGPTADAVLDATTGMDATVLYTSIPRPIDARGLRASVTGTDIVIVEPYLAGTSVAQVAAALSDRPMRIRAIGVTDPELEHYGSPADLRSAHGLDSRGIRRAIERGVTQIAV